MHHVATIHHPHTYGPPRQLLPRKYIFQKITVNCFDITMEINEYSAHTIISMVTCGISRLGEILFPMWWSGARRATARRWMLTLLNERGGGALPAPRGGEQCQHWLPNFPPGVRQQSNAQVTTDKAARRNRNRSNACWIVVNVCTFIPRTLGGRVRMNHPRFLAES